jgi:hypothetical protein
MYRRTWTPSNTIGNKEISTIHFYDSGILCGTLVNDTWNCWEIISREKDLSGCIHEILKLMPQDYVPFHIIHSESSPVYEISQDRILIPEWTIQVQPFQAEKAVSQKPVLQKQIVPSQKQAPHQQIVSGPRALAHGPQVQQHAHRVQQHGPQALAPDRLAHSVKAHHAQYSVVEESPRIAPRPPPRPVRPPIPEEDEVSQQMLIQASREPLAKRQKKAKKSNERQKGFQHQSQQGLVDVKGLSSSAQKAGAQQVQLQQSQAQLPLQKMMEPYPSVTAQQSSSQAQSQRVAARRNPCKGKPVTAELTNPSSTNSA